MGGYVQDARWYGLRNIMASSRARCKITLLARSLVLKIDRSIATHAARSHCRYKAAEPTEDALPGIVAETGSKEALESLVKRYVGATHEDAEERTPENAQEAPLRDQIAVLRSAVQNAAPIVSLSGSLTSSTEHGKPGRHRIEGLPC
jgi:hypothetical protein